MHINNNFNNQQYFLEVVNKFNSDEKESIINELNNLNIDECLSYFGEIDTKGDTKIEPIPYIEKNNIKNVERYLKMGIKALRNNEYGVVILAGGQGTRLGFNGPKGIFKIFPQDNITFFSLYINRIKQVEKRYSCKIPLYIMTSKDNNIETIKYFEEKNYFDRKNYIDIFEQDELPMFLENKNLIVDENKKIKFASNGHGNVFKAMKEKNVIDDLMKRKVKYILITGLDNILMKPVDEVPLGIMIDKNVKSIGKSIKKERPDEKMGVFCRKDGKVSVIEYSEISKELSEKRKGENLVYADAHLLWNIYRVEDLYKLANKNVKYHLAHKKCNYLNENGELVVPNKANAYKFESFIFDFFEELDDMIIYRVNRNEEYAPIKNAEGIDSLETAKKIYRKTFKKNKKGNSFE